MKLSLFSELASLLVPNHRIEPVYDIHLAACMGPTGEGRADTDESANRRENRQHDQRHPHRLGRFMRHVHIMMRRPVLFLLRMTFVLHAVRMFPKSLFAPE